MTFSDFMKSGIDRIYKEDFKAQSHYISTIAKDVRNMKPDILYKVGSFFVPNNEYMLNYFGEDCANPEYDIYNYDGTCVWQGNLVIPIYNIASNIVGLIGFDPVYKLKSKYDSYEDGEFGYIYNYSKKSVFERGKYIFTAPGILEKAIEDKYIIIVDGTFDALSLVQEGFNGASFLGSSLNDYLISQIKFIENKFIAYDNDEAGLRMYNSLKKKLPDLLYIKQGFTKDIDDYMKEVNKDKFRDEINRIINSKIKTNTKLDLF